MNHEMIKTKKEKRKALQTYGSIGGERCGSGSGGGGGGDAVS